MSETANREKVWSGCCLAAAILLAGAGCTRTPANKYVVSGEITCDGEPVQEGHLALVPLDGSLVPDNVFFKEGKYTLLATPGEKRVEIRASRVSIPAVPGASGEWRESIIPSAYNSESRLTVDVQRDNNNRFDFHLSTTDIGLP